MTVSPSTIDAFHIMKSYSIVVYTTNVKWLFTANLRIQSLIGLTPERKLDYFLQKQISS